ncbi:MAG TPA: UDP-glucose 4-epimerase GalE [Roseiarcus sp.]
MVRNHVLVTGGVGFIGSHVCKCLNRAGFTPVSFDNLSAGHSDCAHWGPLVVGDIRDRDALVETLQRWTPLAVIHLAGAAYVGESVEHPTKYYDVNVIGSQRLLEACRQARVDHIVFSSSCATYGAPPKQPINEGTQQEPINPYGRTKLFVEKMIIDYAQAYGLRYAILRYFNAAGADPDRQLSERHAPETHLIPIGLLASAHRLPFLPILGDDYDTPDGTCIRDFIHVTDLAEAHVAALQHLLDGATSRAVNLGAGVPTSVREVVSAIRRATGKEVPIVVKPRRPGDPATLVADIRAARETLGFRPRYSDIDTIVRTAAVTFGHEIAA